MSNKQGGKRKELDIRKLVMSKYDVHFPDDSCSHEFHVKFNGPLDTPYHGGIWKIQVTLPNEYPYKSPSIGFMNRIFHPNVDEMSGSVCLDVINQTWSPMFDLVNVFDAFLPQLLRYPNPSDPLNGEAAAMLLRNPESFNTRAKDSIRKYASTDFSFDESSDTEKDEEEMDVSPTVVGTSTPMRPLPAPYDTTPTTQCGDLMFGSSDTNSILKCSTGTSSNSYSDTSSLLSSSWNASSPPASLCGYSISPFSSPSLQSVLSYKTTTTSLEEFVKDGMDVIDDGASDISDMSDL